MLQALHVFEPEITLDLAFFPVLTTQLTILHALRRVQRHGIPRGLRQRFLYSMDIRWCFNNLIFLQSTSCDLAYRTHHRSQVETLAWGLVKCTRLGLCVDSVLLCVYVPALKSNEAETWQASRIRGSKAERRARRGVGRWAGGLPRHSHSLCTYLQV